MHTLNGDVHEARSLEYFFDILDLFESEIHSGHEIGTEFGKLHVSECQG